MAKSAGTAKITVTSKSNKKLKKTVTITVQEKPQTTTEQPTTQKQDVTDTNTTEKDTSNQNTTEQDTTEAPTEQQTPGTITPDPGTSGPTTGDVNAGSTTEEPTTEAPTTEEPYIVGIEASYRGDKVPKGSIITRFGVNITGVYSDGSTNPIIIDYYNDNDINLKEIPEVEKTLDGKLYNIYTISYKDFSDTFKVEVVNVGDTIFPLDFSVVFKRGIKIKKDCQPTDEMIDSVHILLSDWSEDIITDTSMISYTLFFDYGPEGRDLYDFIIIYDYWFEYEGEQLYINCYDKEYFDYEE